MMNKLTKIILQLPVVVGIGYIITSCVIERKMPEFTGAIQYECVNEVCGLKLNGADGAAFNITWSTTSGGILADATQSGGLSAGYQCPDNTCLDTSVPTAYKYGSDVTTATAAITGTVIVNGTKYSVNSNAVFNPNSSTPALTYQCTITTEPSTNDTPYNFQSTGTGTVNDCSAQWDNAVTGLLDKTAAQPGLSITCPIATNPGYVIGSAGTTSDYGSLMNLQTLKYEGWIIDSGAPNTFGCSSTTDGIYASNAPNDINLTASGTINTGKGNDASNAKFVIV